MQRREPFLLVVLVHRLALRADEMDSYFRCGRTLSRSDVTSAPDQNVEFVLLPTEDDSVRCDPLYTFAVCLNELNIRTIE